MEKHLLNYSKKPELPDNIQWIIGNSKGKTLYKKTHIFITKVIPTRVILNKNIYKITHVDKLYHMDGFTITTENDKVIYVRIFGYHPNCDPDTDIFCLPDFKKGVHLSKKYLDTIINNIQTYYLDSCYFNPTGLKLRYEKMKSMYI